jgi:hypothetical protein
MSDPFYYKKVGNVYDRSGRKIGTVHSNEPSGGAIALFVLVILGVVIAGIVSVVGGGYAFVRNGFKYGAWEIASERQAEFDGNLNNPNYFSELAGRSQLSVAKDGTARFEDGMFVYSVNVTNNSDENHAIFFETVNARVKKICDGCVASQRQRVVSIFMNCSRGGNGAPAPTGYTVAARTTTKVDLYGCTYAAGDGVFVANPAPAVPKILAIDGFPTSGGPPNTGMTKLPSDCYCEVPKFITYPAVDLTSG